LISKFQELKRKLEHDKENVPETPDQKRKRQQAIMDSNAHPRTRAYARRAGKK
jgi:hypothetical protein